MAAVFVAAEGPDAPISVHPEDQQNLFVLAATAPDIAEWVEGRKRLSRLSAEAATVSVERVANDDTAPWILRNWWIIGGALLGFLYAAVATGALGTPSDYRPGEYPSGALPIGIGIAWVLDRVLGG